MIYLEHDDILYIMFCIKFFINITFAYVKFEKYDLCVYLKFENDFGNDTLGYTEIRWLRLSTK